MKRFEQTVGVVGLGQIGGSICAALKSQTTKSQIIGYDTDETILNAAFTHNIIDSFSPSMPSLLDTAEIIVLATPIESIYSLLRLYKKKLQEKLLVLDTGSLKADIMLTASKLKLPNFIGGHPITGTEKRGTDAWDNTLFHNTPFLFATTPRTSSESLRVFHTLMEMLHTTPVSVDPQEHDRLFALTIGIPHILALIIKQQFDEVMTSSFDKSYLTGPSFHGITRVADSSPELIQQMLWINRHHLNTSIKKLIEKLEKFSRSIDNDDINYLKSLLPNNSGYLK